MRVFSRFRRPLLWVAALLLLLLLTAFWTAKRSFQSLEGHLQALGFRDAKWGLRGIQIASLQRHEPGLGLEFLAEGISAQWWPGPLSARIDSLEVQRWVPRRAASRSEMQSDGKDREPPDRAPTAPPEELAPPPEPRNSSASQATGLDPPSSPPPKARSSFPQAAPWLQAQLQKRSWSLDIEKGPLLRLGDSRFVALESLHLRSSRPQTPSSDQARQKPSHDQLSPGELSAHAGEHEALPWLTLEAQIALHLRKTAPTEGVASKSPELVLQAKSTEHWTIRCERSGPFALRQLFLPWRCHLPDLHPEALMLHLSTDGQAWSISARDPQAGGLEAKISVDSKARRASLFTQALPFAWIEKALKLGGKSLPQRLRFDHRTTMNGELALEWNDNEEISQLQLREFSLSPMMIHHHRLAADAFELPLWSLTGSLQSEGGHGISWTSPSLRADIHSRWGELETRMRLSGNLERFDLSVTAPAQDCQTWLEALPAAWRKALAGAQLRGQVGASFDLSVDREQLQSYVTQDPGIEKAAQLGLLNLHFPFRRDCELTQEPHVFSKAALLGETDFTFPPESTRRGIRRFNRKARRFIPLRKSMSLARAFVTAEDPDFWEHRGFAPESMRIAFWHNLAHQKILRGASTISQQCARMLWLGPHRNVARKIQEAFLTWRLEERLKKNKILELYTNLIHLGPEIYGIRDAARFYFKKPVYQLNLRQQVFLSLLPPSPHGYSEKFAPGKVDRNWSKKIDRHLKRMQEKEWISEEELNLALEEDEDKGMELELVKRSG